MNVHIRNLRKNRVIKKKPVESGIPFVSTMVKLIVVAMLVFAIINVRVSYNEKAENLNREGIKIKRKIHKLNREIEHLTIKKEALSSWPNVKKKIEEYQLALRMPVPNQVAQLVLVNRPDKDVAESGRLALSQR